MLVNQSQPALNEGSVSRHLEHKRGCATLCSNASVKPLTPKTTPLNFDEDSCAPYERKVCPRGSIILLCSTGERHVH